MRHSGKHQHKNIFAASIAAVVLGLSLTPVTSYADEPSPRQVGSDSPLAARVRQALQSAASLDSKHIDVGVKNGDVVLEGFVQTNRDLLTATQVATKAAGNSKVVNHLTIQQNAPNTPGN